MAGLANPIQHNGAQSTAKRRGSLADLMGIEPFDLIRNFYAPGALDPAADRLGLEVTRSENGYVVEIPVPGFKPEQIEITYKDAVLTVSGKSDRRSFTRSLALPDEIDADNVVAHVEHGLLTLQLNRRPEAQPKQIKINVN